MNRHPSAANRLVDRPSALEAERADVIKELERYLTLLTSDAATPIVQEIASTLAFERLRWLHEIDTADELPQFNTEHDREENRNEQTNRRRDSRECQRPGRPNPA
jgi:hypothetical protein